MSFLREMWVTWRELVGGDEHPAWRVLRVVCLLVIVLPLSWDVGRGHWGDVVPTIGVVSIGVVVVVLFVALIVRSERSRRRQFRRAARDVWGDEAGEEIYRRWLEDNG